MRTLAILSALTVTLCGPGAAAQQAGAYQQGAYPGAAAPGPDYRVGWCESYASEHAPPSNGCGTVWDSGPAGNVEYGGGCAPPEGVGYGADGYGMACGPAVPVAQPAAPRAIWGVAGGALFLARDRSNQHTFSFDDPNEDRQYLDARDVEFDLAPGYELRLARFDVCAMQAVELVYWQLFPGVQTQEVRDSELAGNLSAILNYNQLDYNGATADNSTNNAAIHQIRNDTAAYNVEANWVRVLQGCNCGPTLSSLFGFRFFRFDEHLRFASDPSDYYYSYEADELYYNIDVENTLVGFQLGGFAEQCFTCKWSGVLGAKAGVFANFAEGYSHIGGAAGTAVINNGPNNGRAWRVDNSKTDVAMLAELTAGVVGQLNCHWRLGLEYRLIGIAGLAQPANQVYHDVRGINDVELLKTNGSLILHGGVVSLERLW
ncbi:MAG: hypothetical protein AAGJ46_17410 [Planctomycetota bacterium]